MRLLRAPTREPIVLDPVWPNVGVKVWYNKILDELIDQSAAELLTDVAQAWAKTPPIFHSSHITAEYGDAALPSVIRAAGVLFTHQGPKGPLVLLLHRADGQGWAFPGGGVEYMETPEQTARREVQEETGFIYNGPLLFYRAQPWADVNFETFVATLKEPYPPILNNEHDAWMWVSPEAALYERLHPGVRDTLVAYLEGEQTAEDAPSPTKALQVALAKWGTQTIKKFDLMAQSIADSFATRSKQATQTSMLAQLKKAGFTVAFKPTRKSIEAFRLVAAENVALIRSIPRKYHADVEQKVWNAVRMGSDLHKLSTELAKAHKVTTNRAALIARDQNAKAKATIERVRQMELGITLGIWMHSHAGKEPRPTHVAENNKVYSLAKGFYDKDEEEWVHPGQLINCRCTMRPVIEGFEY